MTLFNYNMPRSFCRSTYECSNKYVSVTPYPKTRTLRILDRLIGIGWKELASERLLPSCTRTGNLTLGSGWYFSRVYYKALTNAC